MASDRRVSGPAVLPSPPAADEWGQVVRPIFDPDAPAPTSLVNTDAYGRYRFSSPSTTFDSQQIVDDQPLFWDDAQTAGGGTSSTFNPDQASTTIAVANLTAGTRVRQTKRAFYYQPGKSQTVTQTFRMGVAAAGITHRVGQFDADNGMFFQQSGVVLAFVIRTKTSGVPVDTVIPQADWNLDKLDGTGPSGRTIDPTKIQSFNISYGWLGAGAVFFGFFYEGALVQAHRFDGANLLTLVYMSVPELPLRCEIDNDGSGPASSFAHVASTVISEGGIQGGGIQYGIDRLTTGMTTLNNTSLYPVLSMRLRAGYRYATIVPQSLSILNTSNASFLWRLIINPTVVGAALAFATLISTSAVEADVTSINTTTLTPGTGTVIASGYGAADSALQGLTLPDVVALGTTIAGVSDIIVLAVARVTGNLETFFAALSYRELR